MATETIHPAVGELSSTVDKLRSDLENVQRELDQALSVWRIALVEEKRQFQAALRAKQLEWNEREAEWQKQRASYAQKIEELDAHFRTQLSSAERDALRTLNELDDAWQRDKLSWSQASQNRIRELETRDAAWAAEREHQQLLIEELQSKVRELEKPALEASLEKDFLNRWEQDKARWEGSLSSTLQAFQERESTWSEERRKQEELTQKLQTEMIELKSRADDLTLLPLKPEPIEWLPAYLNSLEAEVADLNAIVGVLAPSSTASWKDLLVHGDR